MAVMIADPRNGQRCNVCDLNICLCEDPDYQREQLAERYYDEYLRPLIRRATKSDESASLGGMDGLALLALEDALDEAKREVAALRNHGHKWNDSDYCNVCGADGRA